MKSPETISQTPEDIAMHESISALEESISKIEDLRNQLHQALAENDSAKQTTLTTELQNEISKAKKLQAKIEGKESLENILSIDRSADVIKFTGWSGAKIEDKDTDTCSIALKEIDLSKLKLDTSWLGGKSSLNGEKRLEALKTGSGIRLDAQILVTLRNLPKEELNKKMEIIAEANKVSIEDLKKKAIFFDGTIIRDSDGTRHALCLFWGGCEWRWNYYSLDRVWDDLNPSLVLAS